jgi:hypothetical protein
VRMSSRSSVVAQTLATGLLAFAGKRISNSSSLRSWRTQLRTIQLAGGSLVAISSSRVVRVSSVAWLVGESTLGGSLTLMDTGWVYGLVSCIAIVRWCDLSAYLVTSLPATFRSALQVVVGHAHETRDDGQNWLCSWIASDAP